MTCDILETPKYLRNFEAMRIGLQPWRRSFQIHETTTASLTAHEYHRTIVVLLFVPSPTPLTFSLGTHSEGRQSRALPAVYFGHSSASLLKCGSSPDEDLL